MGIRKILQYLPGGSKVFQMFATAQLQGKLVDIDAGGLLHFCAREHAEEYVKGNVWPAVAEFLKTLNYLHNILQWDLRIVFDGVEPKEKAPEEERRQQKRQANRDDGDPRRQVKNTGIYIAACAKACRELHFDFLVAPEEADSQVVKCRPDALVVSGDSDIIGWGCRKMMLVDSWRLESYRIIVLDQPVPLTKLSLYPYIRQHGILVVRLWAAVMGCDVTEKECGLYQFGETLMFKALTQFDNGSEGDLTVSSFARVLHKCKPHTSFDIEVIRHHLQYVCEWFETGGRYYGKNGELKLNQNDKSLGWSIEQRQHMLGLRDPKTRNTFSDEQKELLGQHNMSELLHMSQEPAASIAAARLPEGRASIDDCKKEELKSMVIARGGNITDHDGKGLKSGPLKTLVKAYVSLEDEVPSRRVYFDRSAKTNGVFSKVKTSHGTNVSRIIIDLLKAPELARSCLHSMIERTLGLLNEGKFTDDFDTIVLTAPEVHPEMIYREFAHLGSGKNQKTTGTALQRVLDMDSILYHAIAWDEDDMGRKSLYMLSKHEASLRKDQTTKKDTPMGEKPLPNEYLVFVKFSIFDTTVATDGHCLGRVSHILESYCAQCTAGQSGHCLHVSKAVWLQYHHWGEGRPTPKPKTQELCGFLRRGAPRNSKVTEPASSLMCVKLPRSLPEAEYREEHGSKRNVTEGLDCRYDVFNGDSAKRARLSDKRMCSMRRPCIQKLFAELRRADKDRPSDRPWESIT